MARMLTDLADVLRAAGLDVVEVPGWRTRGNGPMHAVDSVLLHHTATPASRAGDYPSLAVVRDGRDLDGDGDRDGPLAQLGLGRSGTWYVIAAGISWHAGAVDDSRYANPRAVGIEAEHPGDGTPWPAAQLASYVRGVAALQRHYRIERRARGHKEAAVPYGRKIDPTFDCHAFRAAVDDLERAPAPTPAPPTITTEDDPMNDLLLIRDRVSGAVFLRVGEKRLNVKDSQELASYLDAGVPQANVSPESFKTWHGILS